MISTFTYPLPKEQYVPGIGTTMASYTYDGPTEVICSIKPDGELFEVGIDYEPEAPYSKLVLNAGISTHLPVMYYFNNSVNDDLEWVDVHKDVTMENGDVYHEVTNPNLNQNWDCRYNPATKWFIFTQVVKSQNNIHAQKAEYKKEFVSRYSSETYKSFTASVKNDITTFCNDLDTFIAANGPQKNWKYITKPMVGTMPKCPQSIKDAIDQLPNNHEMRVNTIDDLEEGF